MSDTAAATTLHTSFFDEQIRRRRAAWRLALVCLALAAAVGAVLSTIIGPLLLLLVAASLRLLAYVGLAPARSWLHAIETWVQAGISAGEHAIDLIGRVHGVADVLALAPAIGRAALLLLPGMLAGMLLWAALARTGAWFNALNLIPLWIFDGNSAANALSKLERAVVLVVSAALGYALGEWVFALVAAGMGIRLFTRDAPEERSNAIAAYFVAVLAALAMVLWLVPGHGNGLR